MKSPKVFLSVDVYAAIQTNVSYIQKSSTAILSAVSMPSRQGETELDQDRETKETGPRNERRKAILSTRGPEFYHISHVFLLCQTRDGLHDQRQTTDLWGVTLAPTYAGFPNWVTERSRQKALDIGRRGWSAGLPDRPPASAGLLVLT